MKFEDQVCSLELAKKLKELGVKQDSYWSWIYWNHTTVSKPTIVLSSSDMTRGNRALVAPAFTVAELGEMLPLIFGTWRDSADVWFCKRVSETRGVFTEGSTEADARAKMLIYLIENKLITV